MPFVLSYAPSHLSPPPPLDPKAQLETTEKFWRDWSKQCPATGRWSEVVVRSLIAVFDRS